MPQDNTEKPPVPEKRSNSTQASDEFYTTRNRLMGKVVGGAAGFTAVDHAINGLQNHDFSYGIKALVAAGVSAGFFALSSERRSK